MTFFKDFSYRLLRTFALTTAFSGALLMYMGFNALHNNTVFMIIAVILLIVTILLAGQAWSNYQHRPIVSSSRGDVYGSICPHCGDMLKVGEKQCPHCGETV